MAIQAQMMDASDLDGGGQIVELEIEKIVPGGLGLARLGGQVVFVPFTAPGDRIRGQIIKRHRHHLTALCLEILAAGPDTQDPGCAFFGRCGGCQLRRMTPLLQDRIKTDFVREGLNRIGHFAGECLVKPMIPALEREGYRRRVGFKLFWTGTKVQLGFFAGGSNTLVDVDFCPVLDPRLAALMNPLRHLVASLSVREQIPAVDIVVGDSGMGLTFSLLKSWSAADKELVRSFSKEYKVGQVWFQLGLNSRLRPLLEEELLSYQVDGFYMFFQPGDFIQVHAAQNRRLIAQTLLLCGEGGLAWDLFSGIGNFTLPLSRVFKQVKGAEVMAMTVGQAEKNARRNRVANVVFLRENLFGEAGIARLKGLDRADLVLLDPPRTGAEKLCRGLAKGAQRIVYISCDPATFARDAAILVNGDYVMESVQPLDLFPQTRHVEVMALFRRMGK